MKWDVKGNVLGWVNVTRKEMCTGAKEVFRFVNTQAGHLDDHLSFCKKMHGSKIPADKDKATLDERLHRGAAQLHQLGSQPGSKRPQGWKLRLRRGWQLEHNSGSNQSRWRREVGSPLATQR